MSAAALRQWLSLIRSFFVWRNRNDQQIFEAAQRQGPFNDEIIVLTYLRFILPHR
jgi:hypothetical protein